MLDPTAAALFAVLLIGHGGLHLAAYNRLNAIGWSRRTTKALSKALFVEMWLSPPLLLWACQPLREWLAGHRALSDLPAWLLASGGLSLTTALVLFGLWLIWRPVFGVQTVPVRRQITSLTPGGRPALRRFAATGKAKTAAAIPGNQFLDVRVERIELPVAGLPPELDGYRIAHLSDVHLTGHVDPSLMRAVVEEVIRWRPEMVALTGDLVDKAACIDWLPSIFAPLGRGNTAPTDGSFFILGNHDLRVPDPGKTRSTMTDLGWTDLGGRWIERTAGGVDVALVGNEHPWFAKPPGSPPPRPGRSGPAVAGTPPTIFCLSHSPDPFDWARSIGATLMLAGHTHGGQGRLPIAGPLLSPSYHGSRWASGDFYRRPTTLHVTRGLGGVHLLRIRCPPELSLLTLRATPPHKKPDLSLI